MGTNPNNTESYGDGMSDSYELSNASSDSGVNSDKDRAANTDPVSMENTSNSDLSESEESSASNSAISSGNNSNKTNNSESGINSTDKNSSDSNFAVSFESGDTIYQFPINMSGINDNDPTLNKLLNEFIDLSVKLTIVGHTDSTGDKAYNNTLSAQRARSVYRFLISKGYPSSLLTYEGLGENQPIGDNNTKKGRQLNRRVEIIIKK
jgi:outer membrane protein OmpA-like peptidoglycan-associated protein